MFKESDPFSDPANASMFSSAKTQQPKSGWRQLVDGIKNRDWGNTADVVSDYAERNLVGLLGLGVGAATGNPVQGQVVNETLMSKLGKPPIPQDKADTYIGQALGGAAASIPFMGLGSPAAIAASGAGSGVGGQIGSDISGGNPYAETAGSILGGALPFGPHMINGVKTGAAIRDGASNPDFGKMIDITMGSESRFNPDAISPKGARGLMQVMPDTARDPGHGIRPSNGTPADDVRVGTQLYAALLSKYDHDPEKAWAAYNWGEGRVDHALSKYGDSWLEHAPEETQKYVEGNMLKLTGGRELTGPAGPDGLPTNGSVPSIQAENIARVMNDQGMLEALSRPPEEGTPSEPLPEPKTPEATAPSEVSSTPVPPSEPIPDVPLPDNASADMSAEIPEMAEYQEAMSQQEPLHGEEPPSETPPSGFENWFQDSLPDNHPMADLSPEEKLQKGLTEAKPIAREQADMDAAARSNQASELAALQGQGGGLSGLGKQMNSLKGGLDNADFTPITDNFTKTDVDQLVNRINDSSHLSPFDKLKAHTGLLKLLNPEGGRVPAKYELKALSRVLGGNTVAAMERAGVKTYKPTSMLGKIWNTVNAAKTIGDWSDLTKSNATMFLTPGYWKALGTFAKGGLFTEKGYVAARTALREHPDYSYVTRMDIAHTGNAEALGQHEEIFKDNLLEHVPGLRTIMKSSERVYSGVANIVRDHAALKMIEKDRAAGIDVDDPEYLKRAGDLINTLTGRGSFKGSKLGNAFETGMPAISKVLWTPRQYASWAKMTAQAVNPMWWTKASPAMKTQMASGVVSLAGWTISNLAIASALGYQVHKNVLDPLFGKYKIGDTLYDASAGRASTIHAVAKAAMLLATGAEKGHKGDLKTSGDVVMHWMRTHASPAAALIENQFEGKSLRHPINAIGKEQDWLAPNRTNPLGEALTPMSLEGTLDAAKHYGYTNRQTYETGIGEMLGRQATTMEPKKVDLRGFGNSSDDPFNDPSNKGFFK
jgi:hypothetical protein